MDYPVVLERDDNDTILVSFPDFPEAHTYGDTEDEALARARDALATAIDGYIKDRREIPAPSVHAGPHVPMPALVQAKVDLYRAMREERVSKAELARRLHWHGPQVDRLLEMTHVSQLGQLESAFAALGRRLRVGVERSNVTAQVAQAARRRSARAKRMASTKRQRRAAARSRR